MARTVALLRGVNVGGSHKLPMAALRRGLEDAGCTHVETYIQSGNVVLTPPRAGRGDVGTFLESVIAEIAGFAVPVVVRTAAELERTVARNPYPTAGGTQLHVVFFAEPPAQPVLDAVDLDAVAPEELTLVDRDLYLHLPNGMGRAKLPIALEKAGRKVKPPAVGTARNWNTVLELAEMVRRPES